MGKEWFEQVKFGMFIHYGLYSLLGRREWVMHYERIPVSVYRKLMEKFNPRKGAVDEWCSLAKEAGMKYVVLTTRHHDGFSLFDTKVSDFNAVNSAAGRDIIAEYVDACRRYGLKVGFYYSLLDWRWEAYWDGPEKNKEKWDEFVNYIHAQVIELMSNYGKIDVLWYDGGWPYTAEDWRSEELNRKVRELQPNILINDRSGLPEDFDTPEQYVPKEKPERLWETCMTINDSWGYCRGDNNYKTVKQLILTLVDIVRKGGNFLLNISPKGDGSVPHRLTERLLAMGKWLSINGESIYGTTYGSVTGVWHLGYITQKDEKVYVHVTKWPGKEITIPGISGDVVDAYFLSNKEPVKAYTENGFLYIKDLPDEPLDPYDMVIKLEFSNVPKKVEIGFKETLLK